MDVQSFRPLEVLMDGLRAVEPVLVEYCASWAENEPRFWYISPAQHLEELALSAAAACAAGLLALLLRGRSTTALLLGGGPTRTEAVLGCFLLCCMPLNFVNKHLLQSMPLPRTIIELVLLPCHVYTSLGAIALLRTSRTSRVTCYNLMLYCAWMPLLAMAFPDLNSARALSSPLLRVGSISLFYVHHTVLLCTPVCLHCLAASGRFAAPSPRGAGLLQYLAFIYAFVGVLLCGASLATGHNLNYALWPPDSIRPHLGALGDERFYRVIIGALLAFLVGPIMRHVAVPAAAALILLPVRLIAATAKRKPKRA